MAGSTGYRSPSVERALATEGHAGPHPHAQVREPEQGQGHVHPSHTRDVASAGDAAATRSLVSAFRSRAECGSVRILMIRTIGTHA